MNVMPILCKRCEKNNDPIISPLPWSPETAAEIKTQICSQCWSEWEEQAIIVINELSLKLFMSEHQQKLEAHMREFLQNNPLENGENPENLPQGPSPVKS